MSWAQDEFRSRKQKGSRPPFADNAPGDAADMAPRVPRVPLARTDPLLGFRRRALRARNVFLLTFCVWLFVLFAQGDSAWLVLLFLIMLIEVTAWLVCQAQFRTKSRFLRGPRVHTPEPYISGPAALESYVLDPAVLDPYVPKYRTSDTPILTPQEDAPLQSAQTALPKPIDHRGTGIDLRFSKIDFQGPEVDTDGAELERQVQELEKKIRDGLPPEIRPAS